MTKEQKQGIITYARKHKTNGSAVLLNISGHIKHEYVSAAIKGMHSDRYIEKHLHKWDLFYTVCIITFTVCNLGNIIRHKNSNLDDKCHYNYS